ncbi:MAG: riboflavin synthase [Rhizobiales bacterium]|nr:riboflavin synthase [Hyphomicrobiales bacterium]
MFTGLITDIGEVLEIRQQGDTWLKIACGYDPSTIAEGASICCSGVCLTALERVQENDGAWFSVEVSQETLDKTTLGTWQVGTRINLERSLCLGDELGGHLVSGHVDGVGAITSIEPEGASHRFRFKAPDELARFIAPKGSIALNGTSLTVNEVEGAEFGVNLIPHSLAVTTWGSAQVGDRVNMEIDMLARYVARLAEFQKV